MDWADASADASGDALGASLGASLGAGLALAWADGLASADADSLGSADSLAAGDSLTSTVGVGVDFGNRPLARPLWPNRRAYPKIAMKTPTTAITNQADARSSTCTALSDTVGAAGTAFACPLGARPGAPVAAAAPAATAAGAMASWTGSSSSTTVSSASSAASMSASSTDSASGSSSGSGSGSGSTTGSASTAAAAGSGSATGSGAGSLTASVAVAGSAADLLVRRFGRRLDRGLLLGGNLGRSGGRLVEGGLSLRGRFVGRVRGAGGGLGIALLVGHGRISLLFAGAVGRRLTRPTV